MKKIIFISLCAILFSLSVDAAESDAKKRSENREYSEQEVKQKIANYTEWHEKALRQAELLTASYDTLYEKAKAAPTLSDLLKLHKLTDTKTQTLLRCAGHRKKIEVWKRALVKHELKTAKKEIAALRKENAQLKMIVARYSASPAAGGASPPPYGLPAIVK